MSGQPNFEQAHRFAANRTRWPIRQRVRRRGWTGCFGECRRFPGLLFLRGELWRLFQQGAHAIGADFGRRMQPAKSAHARVTRRQDMLEKTAHELQRLQLEGNELAGFAVAIGPQELALRQELDGAIGRGGFEEVSGKVTQSVESGTDGLATNVPGFFPYCLWNLGEQIGLLLEQTSFEEGAEVLAQRFVMEQEVIFDRDPGASIPRKRLRLTRLF